MYTKEQLVEKVKNKKLATLDKVSSYLKLWRIDSIYEDEDNNEYYDDLAVYKLNHGMKLKELGKNNEEISSIVNNGTIVPTNMPETSRHKSRPNRTILLT